jgi:hypothetical protein
MNDEERPTEADWIAYRSRIRDLQRRRAAAGALVVVFVGAVFVVVGRLLAPQDYPAGDIRNEIGFRLALAAFFLVLIGAMLVGALRRLRRDG